MRSIVTMRPFAYVLMLTLLTVTYGDEMTATETTEATTLARTEDSTNNDEDGPATHIQSGVSTKTNETENPSNADNRRTLDDTTGTASKETKQILTSKTSETAAEDPTNLSNESATTSRTIRTNEREDNGTNTSILTQRNGSNMTQSEYV